MLTCPCCAQQRDFMITHEGDEYTVAQEGATLRVHTIGQRGWREVLASETVPWGEYDGCHCEACGQDGQVWEYAEEDQCMTIKSMNPDTPFPPIHAALAVAQAELDTIEAQLAQMAALQDRAAKLRAFLASGTALLDVEEAPTQPRVLPGVQRSVQAEPPVLSVPLSQHARLAQYGRQVLERVGQPMRVTIIARYAAQYLGAPSGARIERAFTGALLEDPAVEKLSLGVYALKAWDADQKAQPVVSHVD